MTSKEFVLRSNRSHNEHSFFVLTWVLYLLRGVIRFSVLWVGLLLPIRCLLRRRFGWVAREPLQSISVWFSERSTSVKSWKRSYSNNPWVPLAVLSVRSCLTCRLHLVLHVFRTIKIRYILYIFIATVVGTALWIHWIKWHMLLPVHDRNSELWSSSVELDVL